MKDELEKKPTEAVPSTDEVHSDAQDARETRVKSKQPNARSYPDHPDDFYRQVAGIDKKEYTQSEVKQYQSQWGQYLDKDEGPIVNDFPNYFYAGFWIRLFAYLIDLLCIQAVTASTLGLLFRVGGFSTSGQTFSVYGILTLAVYLAYFTLLTKYNRGQTIGKMIFGIRVISFTEENLSWKTVLIREVCGRYVLQFNAWCYLGYLPTIFSRRKQNVADYFADTSVVTLNMIQAFNHQARA